MKIFIYNCILSILVLVPTGSIGYEPTSTYIFYKELSLQEPINNTLQIKDVIIWFTQQVKYTSLSIYKKGDTIIVEYNFKSEESISDIELYYKDTKCTQMILKTGVNGSTGIYYNDEAKRMMRMFLSYNEDFIYYNK